MPVGYKIPQNLSFGTARVPAESYQKFVEGLKYGLIPAEAARAAGVKNITEFLDRAMKNEWVKNEVEALRSEIQQKQEWTRERVLGIVEEAIDMSRLQGAPGDMIKGVQEINKMCGYYAPEQREITVESKEGGIRANIETMDERRLLELAGEELDYIEVEFERLDEVYGREVESSKRSEESSTRSAEKSAERETPREETGRV